MKLLRRAAVAAAAIVIGSAGLADPALAAAPPAAPVAPGLTSPALHQVTPKTKSGDLVLYVDGQQAALTQAAVKAGGKVIAARPDRAEITVPADKVATLAQQPGVADVRHPDRAIPMGTIDSEGLAASGANTWNAAGGKKGDGVKIGIIDPGYGDLAASQTAGTLPAQLATNLGTCADGGQSTKHGTSIAEVVHAMAPNATLYLACAGTSMEFGQAATWLQQQGVQVITAALGFLTSGRGDGTGVAGSPADVVRTLSQAGILWSVAAGNLGQEHYTGPATTATDGFVTYAGLTNEANGFTLAAGTTATVGLRWDAWPKTNEQFDLYLSTSPTPPQSPTDPGVVFASNGQKNVVGGAEPTVEATVTNTSADAAQSYYVYVKNVNARQTDRLDLFVSGASADPDGRYLLFRDPAGSVTEPATSPYALAVGASAANSGSVQPFSGRGPTIDGRMKPDLTGYDHVTTRLWDSGGFGGTSVAAANVAGAAALLKSQFPALDAVRLQNELVARANPAKSDNVWGHGGLFLGSPNTQPAAGGSGYTVLDPTRRVDGHFQAANTTTLATFTDAGVPADATAVEVTVVARSAPDLNNTADVPSEVDVFPGDPAASGTRASALPVPTGGPGNFTSMNMIVTLGGDQAVRIRTGGGPVWTALELRGYFSPSGGSTYFPLATPNRVLDTRGLGGSPKTGVLKGGDVYALPVRGAGGVPSNATAVAVDVTTLQSTQQQAIDAYGQNPAGTTLITGHPAKRRSASAIVPIGQDGAIHLKDQDAGATQVVVDVLGSFAPGAGGRYVPLPQPTRIADTTTGTGGRTTPLGDGETAGFAVAGQAGIPADATGAVLTATTRDDNVDTELSAYPDEAAFTSVTSLAAKQGEAAATTLLPGLGASGRLDVRAEHGPAAVAIDAWGYFTGGAKVAANTSDCALSSGEAGYTAAFDGRAESNLDGWQTTGTKASAQDCVFQTGTGNTDATWYSQHSLENDYTLKLDWKTDTAKAASNVLVGFANPGTNSAVPGNIAVRIAPGGTGAQGTGAINGQAPGDTSTVKPLGQWNTYEITVSWNTVTVSLNGTRINGFTTASPALAANTYVGVSNSGSGDPVKFRNVRIKRNEPVASGAVTSNGGTCLDLWNYDITALTLWTFECNGSPAQTFTRAGDGTLAVAGRCVDASGGTGNGTPVGLRPCDGSLAQQWVARDDGSLIGASSGRCLSAANPSPRASLTLQDCTVGSGSTQGWRLPAQHGLVGELSLPGGRCLDLPNNDPTQNSVFLYDCNRSPAQEWVSVGDGTLRVDGKCLDSGGDAKTGVVAAGTGVPQLPCSGAPTQQWVAQPGGAVVNPVSGLCLTAVSGDLRAGVVVNTCTGAALQQWHLSAQTQVRGQLVGIGGKCVDASTPANVSVTLWDCYGPAAQFFNTNGDGTFQVFGKCLDVLGTGAGSGMTKSACSGSATQQWDAEPNGYLVNVATQLVLDDQNGNTGNGNALQIWGANGSPPQKWSTPLRANLAGA